MAAADDLTKPLSGAPRKGRGGDPASRLPWAGLLGGLLLLIVGGVGTYLLVTDDPLGGEPHAVVPIETGIAEATRDAADEARSGARIAEMPRERNGTPGVIQEDASGVTVVRPDGSRGGQSIIISIPDEARDVRSRNEAGSGSGREASEPVGALVPAPDPRLVEESRYGALPRIGDDGARPVDVYARPAPPGSSGAPARVAILVTGLGISQSVTGEAITRLPPDVSLAFAPYGGDLDRLVARARNAGHEIFLQVPMQPFDYPQNDPGPHTLTVEAGAEANIENLHWVMGRFTGYAGIVNFMGGRFTSEQDALAPIIAELGRRGLGIVDDGGSSRARIGALAREADVPTAQGDVLLDVVAQQEAIDDMLGRLEEQARERGFAMATASALPVTIARIEAWARGASGRGITLVPVSAAFSEEVGG
ncbi:MAG: divergent polysaccharide deacetylase family protein [Salinarimonas sp.]|nr:divergent polysaccharide deacetylase family protein [Salinarimonas sp.]